MLSLNRKKKKIFYHLYINFSQRFFMKINFTALNMFDIIWHNKILIKLITLLKITNSPIKSICRRKKTTRYYWLVILKFLINITWRLSKLYVALPPHVPVSFSQGLGLSLITTPIRPIFWAWDNMHPNQSRV